MAHPIEPMKPRDRPAFYSGTEGMDWMERWCDRCIHDRDARADTGPGCPLLAIAYSGQTPMEWTGDADICDYDCIMFRRGDDPGSGEPEPVPDPPGMDGLFARPEARTRMLVQPELVEATS